MPFQSSVYTMVSINDSIFIGGNFSGSDLLGSTFSNIVEYNTHSNTIQVLRGGGVNGAVNSILTKNEGKIIASSIHFVIDWLILMTCRYLHWWVVLEGFEIQFAKLV